MPCGSGSFLLVAYQYMLDYYTKKKKQKLTLQERKQILLDHIYGVDIDEQAVEVTKLSLLLKVLEKDITVDDVSGLAKNERALPSLHNNIKCGNSLIDDATVAGEKAFDWKKEFPRVFKTTCHTALVAVSLKTSTVSEEMPCQARHDKY